MLLYDDEMIWEVSQGGNYLKPKDSVHSTEADNTLDKTNHGERERESVGQLYFERELWGIHSFWLWIPPLDIERVFCLSLLVKLDKEVTMQMFL